MRHAAVIFLEDVIGHRMAQKATELYLVQTASFRQLGISPGVIEWNDSRDFVVVNGLKTECVVGTDDLRTKWISRSNAKRFADALLHWLQVAIPWVLSSDHEVPEYMQ